MVQLADVVTVEVTVCVAVFDPVGLLVIDIEFVGVIDDVIELVMVAVGE